jgi:carbonic anhydrase
MITTTSATVSITHKLTRTALSASMSAALLAAAAMTGCHHATCCDDGHGAAVQSVMTKDAQTALTPAQVIADLKAGNERFVAHHGTTYDYAAQVKQTSHGQYPKAVVLSCLDSRVPPEIVFDQGIGDIFVGRVAGNFENTDMLGSMEFATALAGAKAIVVLGHSHCGAIKGAADDAKLGNLTEMLTHIKPAVEAAKAKFPQGPYNSKNGPFVEAIVEENVRITVKNITQRSPVLADRVAKGELIVVGGVYDLDTGAIEWLH